MDANFDVGTMGEMVARVTRWARERVDPDMAADAINDACQSLWKSVSLASLSRFISSAVSLTLPANATSIPVISVADPTGFPPAQEFVGGALLARTVYVAYSLVTDSGSSTLISPVSALAVDAGNLVKINTVTPVPGVLGFNVYCGMAADQLGLQNISPLSMGVPSPWLEPPAGYTPPPNAPSPPSANTTGDNISSIVRLDVANQDQTRTPQYQADLASALFTSGRIRQPSTSTYVRHAYDLVNADRIEIAPAPLANLDATLFYVVRPRRMHFPQSLLPYVSLDAQQFIGQQALSDVLRGLYEDEAADGWDRKAERERLRIQLQVCGETWNKNKRVRRYM